MIYQCVKSLRETDSFPLTQKKRKLATMAGSKQIKGLSISSEGCELPHSSGRIWCWPHTDAVEQAPLKSDLLPPNQDGFALSKADENHPNMQIQVKKMEVPVAPATKSTNIMNVYDHR